MNNASDHKITIQTKDLRPKFFETPMAIIIHKLSALSIYCKRNNKSLFVCFFLVLSKRQVECHIWSYNASYTNMNCTVKFNPFREYIRVQTTGHNFTNFFKNFQNSNFHYRTWIQHEKCIQMSTISPSIRVAVLETALWNLRANRPIVIFPHCFSAAWTL